MELKEFYARLKQLKIPIAYRCFEKKTPLPFGVYFVDYEDVRGADYKNLINDKQIIIELYTANKNITLENKFEDLFSEFEMEKYEAYIESEKMLQVAYHMNLITRR